MPDDDFRGTTAAGRCTPETEPSFATVQGLEAILMHPVSSGSAARYRAVADYFGRLAPLEAARLHGQLSNSRHPLRQRLERRLSRSSTRKLVDLLRDGAHGYSSSTAPENLDDESLEEAFLAAENRATASRLGDSSSVEEAKEQARARELFQEQARRGTAMSHPPQWLAQEWDNERALHDATQRSDYRKVDIDAVMRRLPGRNTMWKHAPTVVGYYRLLKQEADGEYVETQGPTEGMLTMLYKVHLDVAKRHVIVQAPFYTLNTKTRGFEEYGLIQFWWTAGNTDDLEVLINEVDAATPYNRDGSVPPGTWRPEQLTTAMRLRIEEATERLAGVWGKGQALYSRFRAALEQGGLSSPGGRITAYGGGRGGRGGTIGPRGGAHPGAGGGGRPVDADVNAPSRPATSSPFRPVEFYRGMTRKAGLSARERDFLVDNAQTYRNEMNQRAHIKDPNEQSTGAHIATEKDILKRWPDAVKESDALTGITGPGTVGPRQGDTALRLRTPSSTKPPHDIVVDFKKTAYISMPSRTLYTYGYDKPNKIESDQIQAYEAAARHLNVRVFIINERGDIFTPDLARKSGWIRVAAASN